MKSANHEEVWEKINREILEYAGNPATGEGKLHYSRSIGFMIEVFARLVCVMGDQPERHAITSICGGGGSYTARFMFSCRVKEIWNVLVPCSACTKALFEEKNVPVGERKWNSSPCMHCTQWKTSGDHPLLRYKAYQEPKFPKEMLPPDGYLKPVRITFGGMADAFDFAYKKIINNQWTKEQAFMYLHSFGTTDDDKKEFWKTTQHNIHQLQFFSNNDAQLLWINKPSNWDRALPVVLHIDTIMHLLFLGVWKSIIEIGMDWLSLNHQEAAFIRYARGILQKINKLYLSYCMVLEYKAGKLGGWVSENYLGFARVALWFYSHFGKAKETVVYQEPNKPYHDWNAKECKAWLFSRKLLTTGKKEELKERVKQNMTAPGGPPAIHVTKASDPEEFIDLVESAVALIAVVMQDYADESLIAEMEYRVHHLLTKLELLNAKMRVKKERPKGITSYNFLSLLNLPLATYLLGPMRNYWEGGLMGEGYLRNVKGEINAGLQPGWELQLLGKILRNKALDTVLEQWKGKSNSKGANYSYFRYKGIEDLVLDFQKGNPISAMVLKNGKCGCLLSTMDVVEIVIKPRTKSKHFGRLDYHVWVLSGNKKMGKFPTLDIEHAVLLLPELNEHGGTVKEVGSYTAITDNWMRMNAEKKFVLY